MLFCARSNALIHWICGLLLLALSPAQAQSESTPDQWQLDGELFFWGTGIDGNSVSGGIDVAFDDIFDNLEFAMMGTLAASREEWIAFAQLIYLDLEDNANVNIPVSGSAVQGRIDVGMKGFISTFGGAYRLYKGDNSSLHAAAGARYFGLDLDLGVNIPSVTQSSIGKSGSVWDAVVGLRGELGFDKHWYLTYYADVGTGDSDLTWQATAGINYRFDRFALVLGYSHLEWDFDSQSLIRDIAISGPYAALQYSFR